MPVTSDYELPRRTKPPKVTVIGFAEDDLRSHEELVEKQKFLDQKYVDELMLYTKYGELSLALSERRWALMYLQHIAKRVGQPEVVELIEFSKVPNISRLSMDDKGSNPPLYVATTEQHREVLERRRKDAQYGRKESWAALDLLIQGLTSNHIHDPSDEDIAFRLFSEKSHTPYTLAKGDFRCSNWRDFDISEPLDEQEAKAHVDGSSNISSYIFISTSPRRVWNLLFDLNLRYEVAVIDLRVLRRLGVAYGSTTEDLEFQGTKYATKHHVLVLGWLPAQSIKGKLSVDEFKLLLKESGISVESASEISNPYAEYEKKIQYTAIQRCLEKKRTHHPRSWQVQITD